MRVLGPYCVGYCDVKYIYRFFSAPGHEVTGSPIVTTLGGPTGPEASVPVRETAAERSEM